MQTAGDDLTLIQARLHDGAAIWSRAELLRLYNDGYRTLLAQSSAFCRLLPLDVPGRHSYAVSHPWETRHTSGGTWWFPLLACHGATKQATAQWEAEHLDGVTPSAALTGLTMQWERAHTDETDRHFSFGLPADHERLKRLEWTNTVLLPVAVREFDEMDDAWMRRVGQPSWWTTGVGPVRTVEVYEITTAYRQGYQLLDATTGIPREITGERSYSVEVDSRNPSNAYAYANQGEQEVLVEANPALLSGMGYRFTKEPEDKTLGFAVFHWEIEQLNGEPITIIAQIIAIPGVPNYVTDEAGNPIELEDGSGYILEEWQPPGPFMPNSGIGMFQWEEAFGAEAITFGLGGVRGLLSPDRQYWPMLTDVAPMALVGGIRDWRSSEDNLMALEVVVPTVDLGETDAPILIPEPLQKYLRYYVWSRAFGREGEGQRVDVAQHYDQRFQRGVSLLKRFGDSAQADRVYRRQELSMGRGRPPLVHLPSQFEQVF